MPRKGENIYKRKDGRWEGRYLLKRSSEEKRKYGYVYAHTYRECKEKLCLAKTLYKKNDQKLTHPPADISLKEISDAWLALKNPQLKESTMAKYNLLLSIHILPRFGDTLVERLSKSDIQAFTQQLITCGKANSTGGLAAKTVSDILSLLKNILKYAQESGYHCSPEICCIRLHREQKSLRVLSREEQTILSSLLLESNNLKDMGILLCLFTGLRVGELCALTWDNISIEQETLSVCSTLQRIKELNPNQDTNTQTKVTISSPKSSCSLRTIPLPGALVELLKQIPSKEGYLLTGKRDKYIEPRLMQYHFKKVLKKCDLEPCHFHVLRHTFATRCIELGFDVKTLSELLGHSSVNITLNRYVHPSFELKKDNMQRLSQLLSVR